MTPDDSAPDDREALSRDLETLLRDADVWRARVLATAAELDLFTVLAGGDRDAAALAPALGTHPEATTRLLSALHEMGYLRSGGGRYRNAPIASHFLVSTSPYYLGSWLKLQDVDWAAWGELTDLIRQGRPPTQGSIFHDPRRLHMLLQAAHERARMFYVHRVLAEVDLSGVHTLVDVGGGAGTYSLAFCATYPDLQCTIFDLPEAIVVARRTAADHDIGDRLHFHAGDFTRDRLGGPFDVAFLSNVLHGESPTGARALIENVYRALRPGGRIVVRDSFLDDDGTNGLGGAVFGLALMIETLAGRTYTLSAVTAMLAATGFRSLQQPGPGVLVGFRRPDE